MLLRTQPDLIGDYTGSLKVQWLASRASEQTDTVREQEADGRVLVLL